MPLWDPMEVVIRSSIQGLLSQYMVITCSALGRSTSHIIPNVAWYHSEIMEVRLRTLCLGTAALESTCHGRNLRYKEILDLTGFFFFLGW